ncbi:MAG: alpha/beta fold hydrolase [Acidobacteria bacterium]|nr:alpha/beta fold hydrolase [Acidobacteriota bacterium]
MKTLALVLLAASGANIARIKQTLFIPDPLPGLETRVHGRFDAAPGVMAERVTYATQFGLRVPAIVYSPKPRPALKLPALVIVNGHGGDKYSWYAFHSGIQYARGGAVVLTYDPIGEGERNSERKSGTRAHDRIEQPEELGRRMGGLMITDVMQAVSYLASRPDVDRTRIAAAGYSMGSFVLSLACAVELRLRACVLAGGGNLDGPGEYWDRSKPMCQGIPYRSLSFLGDRAAEIYRLHARRGATLIFNGLEDTVVAIPTHGPDFFADLKRRSGAAFEYEFVSGASHRPYFVTRPVALWLERHLDFPNWTSADIEALPETHISEWARLNGVPMDRLYATEDREGGTRALGDDVPGLSREALSVFQPDEWEREKERLVYESWLNEARARLAK